MFSAIAACDNNQVSCYNVKADNRTRQKETKWLLKLTFASLLGSSRPHGSVRGLDNNDIVPYARLSFLWAKTL
jgi:hypothetical protein